MNSGLIIAVDGPAASGKGTLAKRLAAHFALPALDTGLLYRAVGRKMLDQGSDLSDQAAATALAQNFAPAWLVDGRLRGNEASEAASRVASVPAVRRALLEFQQRFARQPGGAVLDGRDIGTVICPDAAVKLYVTASPETRAHRRWLELGGDAAQVLAEVLERDARDMGRADAPLRPAEDAVVLDTTDMTIDAAVARAVAVIDARLAARGQG